MKLRQLVIIKPIRHQAGQSFERDEHAYPNLIKSAIGLAEAARNMKTPLKRRIVLYPPTKCSAATGFLLAQLFRCTLKETPELLADKPHGMYCKDEAGLARVMIERSKEYDAIILVTSINDATVELFSCTNVSKLFSAANPNWQVREHAVIWEDETQPA